MNRNIPQILVGGTSSGSGKTTFSLGLMAALAKRGLNVSPYKCGPDYIDTKYYELATKCTSINLDSYLCSKEHIRELYYKYTESNNADVCIIEGVMGLYDGYNRLKGSSALIANTLNVPIILVVNGASTAYSVAPIIYGFKNFYKEVEILGVVFNKVSGEHHYNLLKEGAIDCGVEPLGYIPKRADIEIPSRHLGLSLEEISNLKSFVDNLANIINEYVDIDKILQLYKRPLINSCREGAEDRAAEKILDNYPDKKLNIAVAKDEAFNFIYRENIAKLEELGRVHYFSPIHDNSLPECNLLYLPGGYPEFYLDKLSAGEAIKGQIKSYIEEGGYTLAECGGMMYLCNSIIGMDDKEYKMCGVLDMRATMRGMKLHLGYRDLTYNGVNIKGHEFHYSTVEDSNLESVAVQYNAKGDKVTTSLYRYKNLIAGYTHLYWGELNILDLFK